MRLVLAASEAFENIMKRDQERLRYYQEGEWNFSTTVQRSPPKTVAQFSAPSSKGTASNFPVDVEPEVKERSEGHRHAPPTRVMASLANFMRDDDKQRREKKPKKNKKTR